MATPFQKNLILGLGISNQGAGKLEDLLQKPPTERARVVVRLGEVHLDHWKNLADRLVSDRSSTVRIELSRSISAAGGTSLSTLPLASKLAEDGNWRVRLNIIEALHKSGDKAAFETLFKLTQDLNPQVRLAALTAFNNLCALHPVEGALFKLKVQLPETKAIQSQTEIIDDAFEHHMPSGPGGSAGGNVERSKVPRAKNRDGGKKAGPRMPLQKPIPAKKETSSVDSIRVVNAWFTGHADPETPLEFYKEYKLNIEVSPINRAGTQPVDNKEFNEPPGARGDSLDMVVAIISDDFEFLEKPVKRTLLPEDKSKTSQPVSFRIRPIHSGGLRITVLFYYKNNLFHEAVIGCNCALQQDVPARRYRGYLPVENFFGASSPAKLDLNLQVKQIDEKTCRLIAFCDSGKKQFDIAWCNLKINPTQADGISKSAQAALLAATDTFIANGNYRFAESEASAKKNKRLPAMRPTDGDTYQAILKKLAVAGRTLLGGLFYPADNEEKRDPLIRGMENFLKTVARGRSLRIQVLSNDFFFPWNLLYDGEFPVETIQASDFWGLRHQIEEVPRELVERHVDAIPVKDKIHLGLNINGELPKCTRDPLLAEARTFGANILPTERYHKKEVLKALYEKDPPLNLEYFFCHAETAGIPDHGYDESHLILSQDEIITLNELVAFTLNCQFNSNPFFILNACGSAKLDGRFYDGFVHRLLGMGAASVVGTDADVPIVFAAHFGRELIRALLRGRHVGEALLEIRQQMVKDYMNPLGLLYRVFGSADAHFAKALLH